MFRHCEESRSQITRHRRQRGLIKKTQSTTRPKPLDRLAQKNTRRVLVLKRDYVTKIRLELPDVSYDRQTFKFFHFI